MSERTHLQVQQWLQQAMPHATADELSELTEKYPYFSAAQVLLFRRLNATDGVAQKNTAALHVYNPLSLDEATEIFDFPFAAETASDAEQTDIAPQKENQTFLTESAEAPDAQELAAEEKDLPVAIEENVPVQAPEEPFATPEAETDPAADAETLEAKEKDSEDFPPAPAPSISLPTFNLNAPPAAPVGDLTFEPFHTVDYFASQGIRLSQADGTNDKFGKQLKSFTEWLKTMKKLPATAITANTDNAGEKKVENLAAHSLQNADIITESMAEVWVKQGNWEKASEVYNKLSLQNPSKKAYFAAKIESLKKPS